MARRIVFEDHKAKYADQRLELEMRDGSVFTIDPPQLWPDDVITLSRDNDLIALAKVILGGVDKYDQFVAAGGTAGMLGEVVQQEFGSTIPELQASSSS